MTAESKPAKQRATMQVDRLKARLKTVERERDALMTECDRLVHQVICCGVAASHPDAGLTLTGAYASELDSIQAQQVREMRAERDALRAEVESARSKPWEKCKHHGHAHASEWACPTCMRELRKERKALQIDSQRLAWLCKTNGWDERDIAEIDAARGTA